MSILIWFLSFPITFAFGIWLMTEEPTLLPPMITQTLMVILPFYSLFGLVSELTDTMNDVDDAPTRWMKTRYQRIRSRSKKSPRRFSDAR